MAEVWQISSKKMAENMEETEENSAEVRRFTRLKMADMKEKAA